MSAIMCWKAERETCQWVIIQGVAEAVCLLGLKDIHTLGCNLELDFTLIDNTEFNPCP